MYTHTHTQRDTYIHNPHTHAHTHILKKTQRKPINTLHSLVLDVALSDGCFPSLLLGICTAFVNRKTVSWETRSGPHSLLTDRHSFLEPYSGTRLACPSLAHLAISEQRWEMEEERLTQRHCLDGVVETLALVQLHLGTERKGHSLRY